MKHTEMIFFIIVALVIAAGAAFFAYSWEQAVHKMFNQVTTEHQTERR